MRAEGEKLGNQGEIAHDHGDYRGQGGDGKSDFKAIEEKRRYNEL